MIVRSCEEFLFFSRGDFLYYPQSRLASNHQYLQLLSKKMKQIFFGWVVSRVIWLSFLHRQKHVCGLIMNVVFNFLGFPQIFAQSIFSFCVYFFGGDNINLWYLRVRALKSRGKNKYNISQLKVYIKLSDCSQVSFSLDKQKQKTLCSRSVCVCVCVCVLVCLSLCFWSLFCLFLSFYSHI